MSKWRNVSQLYFAVEEHVITAVNQLMQYPVLFTLLIIIMMIMDAFTVL